ncbi:FecCD family ABC transporter permease [Niallia circulans]|uniref:FecCD family ABC transporter permease n=1 Tax=Niallia circulans TaxID=1397 RepID=UPI00352E1D10
MSNLDKEKVRAYAIIYSAPFLCIAVILLSISLGTMNISLKEVFDAFFYFNAENVEHTIIRTARLPRAVGTLLIGGLLAMSGAMMQGMTRNYLASPSIMGVSDGAAFMITLAFVFVPGLNSFQMVAFSFIGSALGVFLVLGLASIVKNGFSPLRLAIIGTVFGSFLSSLSSAIASYFQVSQNMSFWYNARLHQLNNDLLLICFPLAIIGIVLALSLSKSIAILSLGKEIATSLGQKTFIIQLLTMASVVMMTGISVSLAGKIGFVGLIIPHITRMMVGIDYRKIIPCSGIIGAIFLVICDTLSRFINYPFESPIGIVTAFLGVPFYLYLIKTKGGGNTQRG